MEQTIQQPVETEYIESLRRILSTQQHRDVPYDEASEIGYSLITFYQLLAEAE